MSSVFSKPSRPPPPPTDEMDEARRRGAAAAQRRRAGRGQILTPPSVTGVSGDMVSRNRLLGTAI